MYDNFRLLSFWFKLDNYTVYCIRGHLLLVFYSNNRSVGVEHLSIPVQYSQ